MTRYPLSWPEGWPRTLAAERIQARFATKERQYSQISNSSYVRSKGLSVAEGVSRVMAAIRAFTKIGAQWRMDPEDVIVSTNLQTRLDGLPRSGQREPDDPGVAVYWREYGGETRVMAIEQ